MLETGCVWYNRYRRVNLVVYIVRCTSLTKGLLSPVALTVNSANQSRGCYPSLPYPVCQTSQPIWATVTFDFYRFGSFRRLNNKAFILDIYEWNVYELGKYYNTRYVYCSIYLVIRIRFFSRNIEAQIGVVTISNLIQLNFHCAFWRWLLNYSC